MKCFFCDTQAKEDSQIFLSTENFFARFDDFPINPGHCEIIPKEHIVSFFDLNDEQMIELKSVITQAKAVIDEKFNPPAYNIGINEGVEAGRTVPHLHIHLIPRYEGDVSNPKGGVRNIIPAKADYVAQAKADPEKREYVE
jgi:diadenosine tetraphosphate (Ap4A) HIT family hydrolase